MTRAFQNQKTPTYQVVGRMPYEMFFTICIACAKLDFLCDDGETM